jgi:hypothetical protein
MPGWKLQHEASILPPRCSTSLDEVQGLAIQSGPKMARKQRDPSKSSLELAVGRYRLSTPFAHATPRMITPPPYAITVRHGSIRRVHNFWILSRRIPV